MRIVSRHDAGLFRQLSSALFFDNGNFGAGLLVLFLIFDTNLFLCGLVAALIGYGYTTGYSTPKILKDTGLIAINCFFFGIAMASLFQITYGFYLFLILGSLVIPPITKATYEVLQHWKLSPIIGPYIFVTWIVWLCGHGAQLQLQPQFQSWPENIHFLTAIHPEWPLGLRLAQAVFQSMGRLFFLPDPLFGIAVFSWITVFSPKRGLFFLLGTLIATLTAYLMSAGSYTWEYGYLSYSAGILGLGLASSPEKLSWRTILLFCSFSTFITLAMDQFLGGLQLPALSLPYVLTHWIAQLSRSPKLSISWAPSQAERYPESNAQKKTPERKLIRRPEEVKETEEVA